MRIFAALTCLWMAALTSPAAEIVAWKVPLSHFVERELQADGIGRIKTPPEASPFFKEGDELWDLKATQRNELSDELSLPEKKETDLGSIGGPQPEWVVWNQTSGRLVTKTNRSGLWRLNQFLRMDKLPKQARVNVEVFEVAKENRVLQGNAVPAASLSCVVRSGKEFETSRQSDGNFIKAKGSVVLSERNPLSDIVVDLDMGVKNHRRMTFKTSLTLHSDAPYWVARDFDGEEGLDVRLSCGIELIDGTPERDAVLIQSDEASKPLIVNRDEMERYQLADGEWLAVQWMDLCGLSALGSNAVSAGSDADDPFAVRSDEWIRQNFGLNEIVPPRILKNWFDRPVWNLGDTLKKQGINLSKHNDFAGYDPATRRLFFLSKDKGQLDKFELLFSSGCRLIPKMLVCSVEGMGHTRIVTRSGQKCRIARTDHEQKEVRAVDVEPVIGESGDLIDLTLDFRDESYSTRKQSLKTSVTLAAGQESQVGAEVIEKLPIRLKAQIESVDPR